MPAGRTTKPLNGRRRRRVTLAVGCALALPWMVRAQTRGKIPHIAYPSTGIEETNAGAAPDLALTLPPQSLARADRVIY